MAAAVLLPCACASTAKASPAGGNIGKPPPMARKAAAEKPGPEDGPWKLSSAWKGGECEISSGKKLSYTFRIGGGAAERREAPLFFPQANPPKPLALMCSEDRTVVLWPSRIQEAPGANGVYLGSQNYSGSSLSQSAVFTSRALKGVLLPDGRAAVLHASARVSFWDFEGGRGGANGEFALDERADGRVLVKSGDIRPCAGGFMVLVPDMPAPYGREFHVKDAGNGNIGVKRGGVPGCGTPASGQTYKKP